jgi:cytochrome c553
MWRKTLCVAAAVVFSLPLTAGAADSSREVADALMRMGADAALKAKATERGGSTATFCANCHGASGISAIPEVPNLAAQNPDYLLKQIELFVTGGRKNAFMEGLMKALSPDERAELVLFYSSRPAPPAVPDDGALVETGRKAFASLCVQCHGTDAHGDATTPRLAGQQPEYLRISLTRYLTVSGERIYPPMTAQVTKLGKDRIEAVVHYLRTLK